jgi:hypothetical protein
MSIKRLQPAAPGPARACPSRSVYRASRVPQVSGNVGPTNDQTGRCRIRSSWRNRRCTLKPRSSAI